MGPTRIGTQVVSVRPPRWTDGPSWCATQRQDEERFSPALGSHDRSWAESTSMTAWVEHLTHLRAQARQGLAAPFIAVIEGEGVVGEVNYFIDPTTAAAEISLWMRRGLPTDVVQMITAGTLARMLALPAGIRRIIAPIAVDNPHPRRLLADCGFTPAGHARELREFRGTVVDHDIWWLDRNPDQLAMLHRMTGRPA